MLGFCHLSSHFVILSTHKQFGRVPWARLFAQVSLLFMLIFCLYVNLSAHQRFGRLPWARLFAPAIKMASDGIQLGRETAIAIDSSKGNLNLR